MSVLRAGPRPFGERLGQDSVSHSFDADPPTATDVDEAVLAAVFSQFPSGLHILDTRLRFLRFNSAAQHNERFSLEGAIGRPLGEVLRRFDIDDTTVLTAERLARQVLATGEPARGFLVHVRLFSDRHAEMVASISWFRLQDPGGRVLGVAAVITDITEQHRAQERLRLLDRAGARIGTTLGIVRTAQELAEALVPDLADLATVDLLDPVLGGEAAVPGASVEQLPLRRVGHRATEGLTAPGPTPPAAPGPAGASGPPLGSRIRHSLTELRPRLVRRLERETEWLAAEPEQVRLLLEAGLGSLIAVPLVARGSVLGVLCLYRHETAIPFEDADLVLAEQLAARAALCLDNARLHTQELSAARILRLSLRPAEVSEHSAVETAYSYLPTGTGGDWFDVIQLSGARVALVTGSTSGRSIRAAAAMGELRAAIRALSALDLQPGELLARLHDLVTRLGGERKRAAGSGTDAPLWRATCLYTVYDPIARTYAMARAGDQPSPAIVTPEGRTEVIDVPEGRTLGEGVPDYTTVVRRLPEGTVVTLYNAALLLENTRQERVDRLLAALATGDRPLQEVCNAVLGTRAAVGDGHDAVLLMARTRVLGPDQLAAWTLPNDLTAVALARKLTAEQLDRWGLHGLCFATELVVSELVTNAVRYSTGPVLLRMIRDRALICEVTDDAATAPQLRRADDSDEGGRGLYIIAQVTQGWGHRAAGRGKTIWTEQALPVARPVDQERT